MSWTIGINGTESKEDICGSFDRAYAGYQVYGQTCCLPKHTDYYTITCGNHEDYHGWDGNADNGWDGGYLEINGDKYCEDFLSGTEMRDILPNVWSNQTGMIPTMV